ADVRIAWKRFRERDRLDVRWWFSLGTLIEVLIDRDEVEEAGALATEEEFTAGSHAGLMFPSPGLVLGRLLLAQGRTEEGVETLLAVGGWMERHGYLNPSFCGWREWVAPALAAVGREDEAREIADEG